MRTTAAKPSWKALILLAPLLGGCSPHSQQAGTMAGMVQRSVVDPAATAAGSMMGPPADVSVLMVRNRATAELAGPFDPLTGRRMLTHLGSDGVVRVVVDPASFRPILSPEVAPEGADLVSVQQMMKATLPPAGAS